MPPCSKYGHDEHACVKALLRSATRLLGANGVQEKAVPYTVGDNDGTILITGGGANASNQTLPDPGLWAKRSITIVNYSGAAQTVLSQGTGNKFKAASGAATANVSLANNAKGTYRAIGGFWVLAA